MIKIIDEKGKKRRPAYKDISKRKNKKKIKFLLSVVYAPQLLYKADATSRADDAKAHGSEDISAAKKRRRKRTLRT